MHCRRRAARLVGCIGDSLAAHATGRASGSSRMAISAARADGRAGHAAPAEARRLPPTWPQRSKRRAGTARSKKPRKTAPRKKPAVDPGPPPPLPPDLVIPPKPPLPPDGRRRPVRTRRTPRKRGRPVGRRRKRRGRRAGAAPSPEPERCAGVVSRACRVAEPAPDVETPAAPQTKRSRRLSHAHPAAASLAAFVETARRASLAETLVAAPLAEPAAAALVVEGRDEDLRRHARGRRHRPHRARRHLLRPRRPERRRQDDDAVDDRRAAAARPRLDPGERRGCGIRSARREAADGRAARPPAHVRPAHRTAAAPLLRRSARSALGRRREPHRRPRPRVRPVGCARPRRVGLLRRHGQEGHARRRDDPLAAAAGARRALRVGRSGLERDHPRHPLARTSRTAARSSSRATAWTSSSASARASP